MTMFNSFETMIGLRYVRARRRNHIISFISMSSMIGVALGGMALITVISVMNGFEKELKDRILGMASHAVIEELNGLKDWQLVINNIKDHPEIVGAAPYFHAEGMLTKDKIVNENNTELLFKCSSTPNILKVEGMELLKPFVEGKPNVVDLMKSEKFLFYLVESPDKVLKL